MGFIVFFYLFFLKTWILFLLIVYKKTTNRKKYSQKIYKYFLAPPKSLIRSKCRNRNNYCPLYYQIIKKMNLGFAEYGNRNEKKFVLIISYF
jgi:hypothetical protein